MLTLAIASLALSALPASKQYSNDFSLEGITQYSLPNGLKVVFVNDPSKPQTTVNLTVFVGSRHENYGEKGMAHLFEHMLFKRTKKFASVKEELTKLGGYSNGTTWFDRTNYFEVFPSDDAKLVRAIELESQRLRFAIISRDELKTEMTVVRNEFEMGENDAKGILQQRTLSLAFQWHNYGNDTIGNQSDIEKVPNEKLLAWYENFYQPDNAMFVLAGKFDEAKAMKAILDNFGVIPRPKRVLPTTYTDEPVQDGDVSFTVRRVGGTPFLNVGYHIAAASDPDSAALEVLDTVLSDAPAGRLYKALIDSKKAAKFGCDRYSLREAGFYQCYVQLGPKDSIAPAREALLSTLEDIGKKPVTKEELERAKTSIASEYDKGQDSVEAIGISLSEYAAVGGDWRLFFLARDRAAAVSLDDVNRVAQKYFKQTNRTLGEYVPTDKPDRVQVAAAADLGPALKNFKGRAAVAQGEIFETTAKNLDGRSTKTTLSSGARLALQSRKTRSENVSLALQMNYGTAASLMNQNSPADFLARMLLRGTKKHTRQQLRDAFDRLQATVNFGAGPQGLHANIEVHKPQLTETLDLVAECLQQPALDPTEFEALRRERLADAEKNKDDPNTLGSLTLQRMLSPFEEKGHPMYVPTMPEIIGLRTSVKVEQSREFHNKFYGSQFMRIAAVGEFDEKQLKEKLESLFGTWKAAESYVRVPVAFAPKELKSVSLSTPDKKMAFFGAGARFDMSDKSPEYPAMVMADYLLGGGMLTGRIPMRLREKEGMSYGAGTSLRVSPFDNNGALIGYAIYAPENVGRVEKSFFEEIERAASAGFNETEMKLAKEGLLKERLQSRAEAMGVAEQLNEQLEVQRDFAYEEALDAKLGALTPAQVSAVFKKYVDAKKFGNVKAGDFKTVAAPK
jgi:zinc protease